MTENKGQGHTETERNTAITIQCPECNNKWRESIIIKIKIEDGEYSLNSSLENVEIVCPECGEHYVGI